MNFEEIKELIKIFGDSNVSKIAIKNTDIEIAFEKGGVAETVVTQVAHTQTITAPTEVAETVKSEVKSSLTLNSPMVGTFYSAPGPNSKSFVQVGDTVSKGETIGILEAMKIMNEWESETNCKILKILIEDGQPVEYGTPIFEIENI